MHINIYIEPFKVKMRFVCQFLLSSLRIFWPSRSTPPPASCTGSQWMTTERTSEGNWVDTGSVNSYTIYAQGVVCAQCHRAVAHLTIYEIIILLPTMIRSCDRIPNLSYCIWL